MDDLGFVGFAALTFLLAGFVKGVTGMGLPTVAMGMLSIGMRPVVAAAMLLVPSFVTNLWQMFSGPSAGSLLRRMWPMMAGIVVGTVGSGSLLVKVAPEWSGLMLGGALIVYAGYALAAPRLSIPRRFEGALSPAVGLVTGVVTGATGVFVVPAVPYLQALQLGKDDLVQALGLSFTVSTVALAVGLWSNGAFPVGQLGPSVLAIVPALSGMWFGQRLRNRLTPERFRQCFLAFLLALGVELAIRPFW